MTLQGFTIARGFGDRYKEGFCLCGFSVHGMRTARIGHKTISRNTLHGIWMFESSLATIAGNLIQENGRYGFVFEERPFSPWEFRRLRYRERQHRWSERRGRRLPW